MPVYIHTIHYKVQCEWYRAKKHMEAESLACQGSSSLTHGGQYREHGFGHCPVSIQQNMPEHFLDNSNRTLWSGS